MFRWQPGISVLTGHISSISAPFRYSGFFGPGTLDTRVSLMGGNALLSLSVSINCAATPRMIVYWTTESGGTPSIWLRTLRNVKPISRSLMYGSFVRLARSTVTMPIRLPAFWSPSARRLTGIWIAMGRCRSLPVRCRNL